MLFNIFSTIFSLVLIFGIVAFLVSIWLLAGYIVVILIEGFSYSEFSIISTLILIILGPISSILGVIMLIWNCIDERRCRRKISWRTD